MKTHAKAFLDPPNEVNWRTDPALFNGAGGNTPEDFPPGTAFLSIYRHQMGHDVGRTSCIIPSLLMLI